MIIINISNRRNKGYFRIQYYGGVTAYTAEQFKEINGYSNLYYNWGKEGYYYH